MNVVKALLSNVISFYVPISSAKGHCFLTPSTILQAKDNSFCNKLYKTLHKPSYQGWMRQPSGRNIHDQARESEELLLPLLGVQKDPRLNNHSTYAEGLVQTHKGSMIWLPKGFELIQPIFQLLYASISVSTKAAISFPIR